MENTEDEVKKSFEDQAKEYKKLDAVKNSQEFKDFFDFQMKTVADKMLWMFLSGKDGDNVKDWNDFCKVRGEIVARLHGVQEVYGAENMIAHIKTQLDQYYRQNAE